MPKRELSKCREWERERRERLKTCFDALARLLPSHDPTITPSKLEILQRAAAHITELQQKNKELLLGDQNSTAIAQRDEVRRLRERVRKLNARTEQLASLLRTAGLKVPKECLNVGQNGIFKGPPRMWSGKLSREKAEILQKEHENDIKSTLESSTKTNTRRKRKRLSSISTCSNKKIPSSENTDPLAPAPIKKASLSFKSNSSISKTPRKSSKKPQTSRGLTSTTSAGLASRVASVLGPGTLILANGSVVPVPAPSVPPATLHRIQLVPSVTQNSRSVILMPQTKNTNTSVKIVSTGTSTTTTTTNTNSIKLPILRPKTASNLRQSILTAKIAIPPLPKKKLLNKKTRKIIKTTGNVKTVTQSAINILKVDSEKKSDQTNDESGKIVHSPIITTNSENNESGNKNPIENQAEIKENNSSKEILNSDKENIEKNKTNDVVKNDSKPETENNDCQNVEKKLELCSIDNNTEISENIPEKNTQNDSPDKEVQKEVILNDSHQLIDSHDHSELSNDIFASLGGAGDTAGVIGAQHTESMSPTAAFLLAFPLVSTLTGGSRISDGQNTIAGSTNNGTSILNSNTNNNNNTNERSEPNTTEDDRQSTPTTLLQIGGTMTLDNNKNNNRTLIDMNLENNKQTRNVLEQISNNSNIKQSKIELPNEKFDNYGYFNQQNTQNCANHACLYEQRNLQQSNSSNFYSQSYLNDCRPGNEVNSIQNTQTHSQNQSQIIQNPNNVNNNNSNNYNNCQSSQAKQNTKTNESSGTNNSKNRGKIQNQRPTVNWMTSPDIRPNYSINDHSTTAPSSEYFLPPFSDVYNGISGSVSTDLAQNNNNNNNNNIDQSYVSWSSGNNRSVLPTLLGDLALGVTSVSNINTTTTSKDTTISLNGGTNHYYQPFDTNVHSNVSQTHLPNVTTHVQAQHQNKESSTNFLSVSSILVNQKSRKSQVHNSNQNHSKKHRERTKTSRTSSNNDANVSNNNFGGTEGPTNNNKKYSGGYSAEELIADSQFDKSANVSTYNLTNLNNLGTMTGDLSSQQLYQHRAQVGSQNLQLPHSNNQQQQSIKQNQSQGYQVHGAHRQQAQQQQQGPFGASYPPIAPNHGEFSALLSAAVVDSYSKTFDSFVHVKPPSGAPVGPTGFDSYCSGTRNDSGNIHRTHAPDGDRRRHSRRSGASTAPRDNISTNIANATGANTSGSFSELSFLSMSGAVSSPVLQDDFHSTAPFLTNAPPPIPTPMASSLTNFNLSAIFPEINKSTTASTSTGPVWPSSKPPNPSSRSQARYFHQSQQINSNHNDHHSVHQHNSISTTPKGPTGYCHSQQHPHGQQLPHEGLYGGPTPSQSFPPILSHHQVQGIGTGANSDTSVAPTNFSFSFTTP